MGAHRRVVSTLLVCCALALSGCSTASSAGSTADPGTSRVLNVVAAENFWGSIATQLGGKQVRVSSIIDAPDADPHKYRATDADVRAVASADLAVVNGVGYDTWASNLADLSPTHPRTVLDVGQLLDLPPDANPHCWYDPADVARVIDQLTADYKKLDPADAAYFDEQRTAFTTTALAAYNNVLADIKNRFAGTAVGASESLFATLSPALSLHLATPPGFLNAVSDGVDPGIAEKAVADEQIATGAIKVYVYNSQNVTPDVQAQVQAAQAKNIPIVVMTETAPAGSASWQQWQTTQLEALSDALAKSTGH